VEQVLPTGYSPTQPLLIILRPIRVDETVSQERAVTLLGLAREMETYSSFVAYRNVVINLGLYFNLTLLRLVQRICLPLFKVQRASLNLVDNSVCTLHV
jgi:hypothetical protein